MCYLKVTKREGLCSKQPVFGRGAEAMLKTPLRIERSNMYQLLHANYFLFALVNLVVEKHLALLRYHNTIHTLYQLSKEKKL